MAYSSTVDLICRFSEHDVLEADQTPLEMVGVNAAIQSGRLAFEAWVPTLEVDISGNSVPNVVEKIADWLEQTGGLYM